MIIDSKASRRTYRMIGVFKYGLRILNSDIYTIVFQSMYRRSIHYFVIILLFSNILSLFKFLGNSNPLNEHKHIFVDLKTIGYEGSWIDFCSPYKMDADFPDDPKHELRVCREMICNLRRGNNITLAKIHVFVVYKFMATVGPIVEDLSNHLVERFANNRLDLQEKLLSMPNYEKERENPQCYETVTTVFKNVCLDEKNPYYQMFGPFFTRLCGTGVASSRDMVNHIVDECRDKAKLMEWNYDNVLKTIQYQVID